MYTLKQFLDSDLSLVIYEGAREVFSSGASDLEPLVQYLDQDSTVGGNLTVFDRFVGRAAALLISTLKPRRVYTGVISENGAQVLEAMGIPFEAAETAKYLMGVASEDMCRWEKLSLGKTPDELLDELRKMRER